MLEKLSPVERTAFVLREAFDFEYSVISEMIEKSESHCRKLVSRAKGKIGIARNDVHGTEVVNEEWIRRFLLALEKGDVDTVASLLADDIVLISDGGGKVPAAFHPLESRDRIVQFLYSLMRKAAHFEGGVDIEIKDINGQKGCVLKSNQGTVAVVLMHVANNVIHRLYFIRNPDKLRLSRLW